MNCSKKGILLSLVMLTIASAVLLGIPSAQFDPSKEGFDGSRDASPLAQDHSSLFDGFSPRQVEGRTQATITSSFASPESEPPTCPSEIDLGDDGFPINPNDLCRCCGFEDCAEIKYSGDSCQLNEGVCSEAQVQNENRNSPFICIDKSSLSPCNGSVCCLLTRETENVRAYKRAKDWCGEQFAAEQQDPCTTCAISKCQASIEIHAACKGCACEKQNSLDANITQCGDALKKSCTEENETTSSTLNCTFIENSSPSSCKEIFGADFQCGDSTSGFDDICLNTDVSDVETTKDNFNESEQENDQEDDDVNKIFRFNTTPENTSDQTNSEEEAANQDHNGIIIPHNPPVSADEPKAKISNIEVTPPCDTEGFQIHPNQEVSPQAIYDCSGALKLEFRLGAITLFYNSKRSDELWGVKGLRTHFTSYITSDRKYLIEGDRKIDLIGQNNGETLIPKAPIWSWPIPTYHRSSDKASVYTTLDKVTNEQKTYQQLWSDHRYFLKKVKQSDGTQVEYFYDRNLNPTFILTKDGNTGAEIHTNFSFNNGIVDIVGPSPQSRIVIVNNFIASITNGEDEIYFKNQTGMTRSLPVMMTLGSSESTQRHYYFGFSKNEHLTYISKGNGITKDFNYELVGNEHYLTIDSSISNFLRKIVYKQFGPYTLPAYFSNVLGNVALRYDPRNHYILNKYWSLRENTWAHVLSDFSINENNLSYTISNPGFTETISKRIDASNLYLNTTLKLESGAVMSESSEQLSLLSTPGDFTYQVTETSGKRRTEEVITKNQVERKEYHNGNLVNHHKETHVEDGYSYNDLLADIHFQNQLVGDQTNGQINFTWSGKNLKNLSRTIDYTVNNDTYEVETAESIAGKVLKKENTTYSSEQGVFEELVELPASEYWSSTTANFSSDGENTKFQIKRESDDD